MNFLSAIRRRHEDVRTQQPVEDVRTQRMVQSLVPMGTDEDRIRDAIRDIISTIPACTCEHTVNAHHRTEKAGVRGFYKCGAVGCYCLVYVPGNDAAQGDVLKQLQDQNHALNHMLELTTDAMNEACAKVRAFEGLFSEKNEDDHQAEEHTKEIVRETINPTPSPYSSPRGFSPTRAGWR